jgi:trans-aconitate methyltransferase
MKLTLLRTRVHSGFGKILSWSSSIRNKNPRQGMKQLGGEGRTMSEKPKERWGDGDTYEQYVGRWSRIVASEFLAWLSVPEGRSWTDVGCGTGGLVENILSQYAPNVVIGIDRSEGFLLEAQRNVIDDRVRFKIGNATDLPLDAATTDVTVSGLVLNFVTDHGAMAHEMVRVTKPGGKVAAYVWDYAGGMEVMRQFWDAAISISPHDRKLDQGKRFPICHPEPLKELFQDAGLTAVSVRAIDISAIFQNFEDYWTPFLVGIGSAPTYLASVDEGTKERIRQTLQTRLEPEEDGTITLTACAWAVQGMV